VEPVQIAAVELGRKIASASTAVHLLERSCPAWHHCGPLHTAWRNVPGTLASPPQPATARHSPPQPEAGQAGREEDDAVLTLDAGPLLFQ